MLRANREQHLERVARRYFAKRNNGAWYRSALKVVIRDLRDLRGDRERT